MLTVQSEHVGGMIVCNGCHHSGPYLKADVRNPAAERAFRKRMACSRCGARAFTLVPKQEQSETAWE